MAEVKPAAKADVVTVDAVEVLKEIRRGNFLHDLSAKIGELTAAVREHKKGGALKITISMAPMNAGDGDIVTVTDDIAVKLPRATSSKSVFFTTSRNTLVRDDPRQKVLDLGAE